MELKSIFRKAKRRLLKTDPIDVKIGDYCKLFKRHSFRGNKCSSVEQYEAVITRWYHTIEKGLAYVNYRAGFGKKNIEALLESMENYVNDGGDQKAFFFETALSTLFAYTEKNERYGVVNAELNERIARLGGSKNSLGGALEFSPLSQAELKQLNYESFVHDRHSMRHFSAEPVELARVKKAIELAQHTPSACNRQGWRTVVVQGKATLKKVLENQNGNEGFGHEFDKLLLVVVDLRYFNRDRELFQPYIDGGMYAQSVLNALHYERIATCPLSASLRKEQEENVRKILSLDEFEVPIIFIGIGNYPEDACQTTRSERKRPNIQVVD